MNSYCLYSGTLCFHSTEERYFNVGSRRIWRVVLAPFATAVCQLVV